MSIPNIIHKIKSKTGIDKFTFMYLCIIVGVGIGAFGLGRISALNDVDIKPSKTLIGDSNVLKIEALNGVLDSQNDIQIQHKEKRYVASKNGKMYYSIGCSGASRIKPENEVWFSSSIDAEKSGYSKSATCK